MGGRLYAQCTNVMVHGGGHFIGQRPNRDATLHRALCEQSQWPDYVTRCCAPPLPALAVKLVPKAALAGVLSPLERRLLKVVD